MSLPIYKAMRVMRLPVAVGVTAVVAVPIVISTMGFGPGIAAGSCAAKLMSMAAISNGGGVAAGSTVAVLQSAGAAGIGAQTGAIIGGTAGGATVVIRKLLRRLIMRK